MKLEDQVVSLELAKELKELGVKQDSMWFWTRCDDVSSTGHGLGVMKLMLAGRDPLSDRIDHYSAFTVAELGEMLPDGFYSYYDEFNGWTCSSPWGFCDISNPDYERLSSDTIRGPLIPARQRRYTEEAKTDADSRAKMIIFLIKAGLIKAEEVEK